MAEPCYVICDSETTGLSAKTERIVSIAASCKGREFSRLVNPQRPIPKASSAIHGLRDEDVRDAPPWAVVGPLFWDWVAQQREHQDAPLVLVAHNAKFDAQFIAAEDARLPQPPTRPPGLRLLDTLALCRRVMPQLQSHKQAAVFQHLFGAPPEAQHDSLGDCRALARICDHPDVTSALPRFIQPLDLDALAGPRLSVAQRLAAGADVRPPGPQATVEQRLAAGADAPGPQATVQQRPAAGADAPGPQATVQQRLAAGADAPSPGPQTTVTTRRCDDCNEVYSTYFRHSCRQRRP